MREKVGFNATRDILYILYMCGRKGKSRPYYGKKTRISEQLDRTFL